MKSFLFFSNPQKLVISDTGGMLCSRMEKPVWQNEDVTARQWHIESAEQLGCMVRHLAELLINAIPTLAARWTQIAMNMALFTSNRHVAGRSFQVASALCQVPFSSERRVYLTKEVPFFWTSHTFPISFTVI